MSNEPDPSGALPDDLRMLYENAIGNIEFAKRQQWWLAAQTLLLYADVDGLALLAQQSEGCPCRLMAEGVEEVPRTRIFETIIQSPGRC